MESFGYFIPTGVLNISVKSMKRGIFFLLFLFLSLGDANESLLFLKKRVEEKARKRKKKSERGKNSVLSNFSPRCTLSLTSFLSQFSLFSLARALQPIDAGHTSRGLAPLYLSLSKILGLESIGFSFLLLLLFCLPLFLSV